MRHNKSILLNSEPVTSIQEEEPDDDDTWGCIAAFSIPKQRLYFENMMWRTTMPLVGRMTSSGLPITKVEGTVVQKELGKDQG
jgi:hypothetical protein